MVRQIKIGKGIASWYQAKVFPILMDVNLGREEIIKERVSILTHASGDILEIGIGTGKNLSCYPKSVKTITAIDSYVRKIENDSILSLSNSRFLNSSIPSLFNNLKASFKKNGYF